MKKLAHLIAICGAMLQLSIPVGFVIFHSRAQAAVSKMDMSRPDEVGHVVSSINRATQGLRMAYDHFPLVLGVALLGVILFTVSVSRLGYRRKWAFWFSCIYGACLLLMGVVGMAFGLFLLVYALRHRTEFGVDDGVSSPAQQG